MSHNATDLSHGGMFSPLQDRSVVHFKIKKNTPLRKLMTAYCERQGFQAGTVRFMFDGNQIGAEQTPIEVCRMPRPFSYSLPCDGSAALELYLLHAHPCPSVHIS